MSKRKNRNYKRGMPYRDSQLYIMLLDINPTHRFPNNKATKVHKLVQKLLELKE